jgi:GntR family transcriptional regulator
MLHEAIHSHRQVSAARGTDTLPRMAAREQGPQFDFGSPVPLYVQAADYVAGLIESGEIRPGTKLDAERDLADAWGIAYGTVRRMTQELRDRGLIVTVQGKGTFVTQPR